MHTILRWDHLGLSAKEASALSAAPSARPKWNWLRRAFDALLTWHERSRQRHALARLDARMLHDIGISRADVQAECDKPFWKA